MENICDKKLCTGCFACVNICPQNCISMKLDDKLCIAPSIDNDRCIDCGLCQRTCPVNNPVEKHAVRRTFAAYASNKEINKASTSGGIATTIATKIIDNGGVVYGSAFTDIPNADVIRCEKLDELKRLQGSKYVHSHMNSAHADIKNDLENGRTVLFIGVGCQVAGLLNYLKKPYDSLFTIDLLCHGCPSREVFNQYTKATVKDTDSIGGISFRSAIPFRNGSHYILQYYDKNGEPIKSQPEKASDYLSGFLNGHIFRENCYHCPYSSPERAGDITLGDYRGLGTRAPFNDKNENGISMLLVNSDKGESLIEMSKDTLVLYEREFDEIKENSQHLNRPCDDNEHSKAFRDECKRGDAVRTLKHYHPKRYFANCIARFIYKLPALHRLLLKIPFLRYKL